MKEAFIVWTCRRGRGKEGLDIFLPLGFNFGIGGFFRRHVLVIRIGLEYAVLNFIVDVSSVEIRFLLGEEFDEERSLFQGKGGARRDRVVLRATIQAQAS